MSNENLTETEMKVMEHRVAGKSYREIAGLMNISPSTVARYVRKNEEIISTVQHAALEERLRQAGGLKADRLVRSATILGLIEDRITPETISELSTPQLIDNAVKLNTLIDRQVGGLKFVLERKEVVHKNLQETEKVTYLTFDI